MRFHGHDRLSSARAPRGTAQHVHGTVLRRHLRGTARTTGRAIEYTEDSLEKLQNGRPRETLTEEKGSSRCYRSVEGCTRNQDGHDQIPRTWTPPTSFAAYGRSVGSTFLRPACLRALARAPARSRVRPRRWRRRRVTCGSAATSARSGSSWTDPPTAGAQQARGERPCVPGLVRALWGSVLGVSGRATSCGEPAAHTGESQEIWCIATVLRGSSRRAGVVGSATLKYAAGRSGARSTLSTVRRRGRTFSKR